MCPSTIIHAIGDGENKLRPQLHETAYLKFKINYTAKCVTIFAIALVIFSID